MLRIKSVVTPPEVNHIPATRINAKIPLISIVRIHIGFLILSV